MKDWQRAAADRVAAIGSAASQEDFEKVVALGGWPATQMDDGCPVLLTPTGFTSDPVGPRCGIKITKGRRKGQRCAQPAGQGTAHLGAGRCVAHGGAKQEGRAEAAWMVAMSFAGELDCSPWEALLKAVRIAAQRVAYTDWVLSQASNDLEIEGRVVRNDDGVVVHPDSGEPLGVGQLKDLSFWVQQNTLWVDRLARYGKMAIDAGVAERLVQTVELEGQTMGRVLTAALSEIEGHLDEDTMGKVRAAMRQELLAIEAEQRPVTQS
jgi:acylphosphatase